MKMKSDGARVIHAPLSFAFSVIEEGGSSIQKYDTISLSYSPNRAITPYVLRPQLIVTDPDKLLVTGDYASQMTVNWTLQLYKDHRLTNILIAGTDYDIDDKAKTLTIKRNNAIDEVLSIDFIGTYSNPNSGDVSSFRWHKDLSAQAETAMNINIELRCPPKLDFSAFKNYGQFPIEAVLRNGDTELTAEQTGWKWLTLDDAKKNWIDISTGKVVATDFHDHPVLLFPQPYSTKLGKIVTPETEGQQFYYANISDEGAILQNGAVKDKFKDRFELITVEMNGTTFPALKIKDNLATAANHTDKTIYYASSYLGKQFICSQLIPIQATAGDALKVLISVEGQNGSGDYVLSADNDYVKFTARLQRAGVPITDKYACEWQRFENGDWAVMNTVKAMQEIVDNILTVHDTAVEGMELFRAKLTYQGKNYYGTCEATDQHDPFYVEMGRSKPTREVGPGEKITYSPRVYDRSTGELSTGWIFTFFFTDYNGDTVTDVNQNTLTHDNIKKHGSIAVRIKASR